jgi:hypothetical protein
LTLSEVPWVGLIAASGVLHFWGEVRLTDMKGSEVCKHFWIGLVDTTLEPENKHSIVQNGRDVFKTVPELVKLANENLPEASKWWFLDQVRPKDGKKWTRAYDVQDLANAAYPESVTYWPGLSDDWEDYTMRVSLRITPKASVWAPPAIRNSSYQDCPLCRN